MPDTFVTLSDVLALSVLAECAIQCKKVARVDRFGGEPVYGIARHFTATDDTGNMVTENLRVTLRSGFEVFWPVSELVPEVKSGHFLPYDWS